MSLEPASADVAASGGSVPRTELPNNALQPTGRAVSLNGIQVNTEYKTINSFMLPARPAAERVAVRRTHQWRGRAMAIPDYRALMHSLLQLANDCRHHVPNGAVLPARPAAEGMAVPRTQQWRG